MYTVLRMLLITAFNFPEALASSPLWTLYISLLPLGIWAERTPDVPARREREFRSRLCLIVFALLGMKARQDDRDSHCV